MNDTVKQRIEEEKKERTGKLDLSGCGLNELPEEIKEMVWLTNLQAEGNRISDITTINELQKLTTIGFGDNRISDISPIKELQNLTEVDFAYNQISDISPIKELQNLTEIDFAYNQISDISAVQRLYKLTEISFDDNQIEDISHIKELRNLQIIHFKKNKISQIHNFAKYTRLLWLELGSNLITDLTFLEGIEKLNTLLFLELAGNPIKGTTISNLNDLDAIKGYLISLKDKNSLVDNHFVKVNILGDGRIGKSQLFNWLTDQAFSINQPETHGTQVSIYTTQSNFKASLWDFGGQSYQHGTHSLFLRPRDFYIVLHSSTKLEYPYGYWLGAARTFSPDKIEDKYLSPVFIVQNVWTENNHQMIYPESKKVKAYQINPSHIFFIDVKFQLNQSSFLSENSYFINKLNSEIEKHAKSFGKVPKKFLNILYEIVESPMPDFYMDKKTFMDRYAKDFSKHDFAYLLQYLEFSGVIVFFREKNSSSSYIFTNPKGLSEWIYKTILDEKFHNQEKGILDFRRIIKAFGEEKAWVFRDIMDDFNLLFEQRSDENKLVIPQFLPENNISFKKVLLELIPFTFSIRFEDFMYEGRIFNFISEYGQYAQDDSSYWKYGILFNLYDIQSIVYYDQKARTIHVHLESNKTNGKYYLLSCEILTYFINTQEREDHIFRQVRVIKFVAEHSISLRDFNLVTKEKFGFELNNPNDKIPWEHYDWLNQYFAKKFKDSDSQNIKQKKSRIISKEEFLQEISIPTKMYHEGNDNSFQKLETDRIILGSQISTNGTNYFDIIKLINDSKTDGLPVGECVETSKKLPLDLFTLKLLGMENRKLKKVFISYNRKDLLYKDILISHLSLLDRYGLVKAWACDQIKAGTWDKQIQDELEDSDIIVYMISHNFMDSDYTMEQEVKKGIELVKSNPNKKIICVLTGVCQWKNWTQIEEIYNNNGGEHGDFSTYNLSEFQFLPYHQYKNERGESIREEIVALEQWGRYPYDVINVAYNQIVDRIFKEIK